MPQSDYILRIAEQVGRALAQILYQQERQDYQGALTFIDEQYKQMLGMGAGFIHGAPEETLLAFLTSVGELDTEKCWLLATLLKAEGEIHQAEGNENDSYYCFLKALNLYLEVLSTSTSYDHLDPIAEIEGLVYKLADYDLPRHTQEMLFRYFERTGRYSPPVPAIAASLQRASPSTIACDRKVMPRCKLATSAETQWKRVYLD